MSRNTSKYRQLRSRLIRRGTNPRRWALANGVPVTTVYAALRGDRAGVKATAIRARIEEFLLVQA